MHLIFICSDPLKDIVPTKIFAKYVRERAHVKTTAFTAFTADDGTSIFS
jgi:hypothetical protein